MTPAAPLITVADLKRRFGAVAALDGVSLSFHAGEMTALIGSSGSGKSTLLRVMAGLTLAESGEVTAFGRVLQAQGRATPALQATRVRIGVIFQQFNLVKRLSLFTNAALGALGRIGLARGILGWWPRAVRLAALAALERVGIAAQASQRAGLLSGGQQQRGAIARALVQGADVILADEPVASLDPAAATRVLDILADLNAREGLTVLISLHHFEHALHYCPRVVALKAGRVVYDGPTKALGADDLARLYAP